MLQKRQVPQSYGDVCFSIAEKKMPSVSSLFLIEVCRGSYAKSLHFPAPYIHFSYQILELYYCFIKVLSARYLTNLNRAVYEELGKYGDLENQVLCRERVEELEPSIRYCLHKIGESNLQTSELVSIGEMEGPALDLFKAKLEVSCHF